jgi:chemotaxis protein methyltransferase CheR
MQEYTRNYQAAGGQHSLSDYIVADDTSVIMSDSLKSNIVFSNHDLATDSAFAEMDVIVCRNVLIYFGKALKNRVFNLFGESLRTGGHLCLGSKESARFIEVAHEFIEVSHPDRIYKKAALKEATIRSGEGS